jgi:uncharacterized membrane protein
MNEQIEGQSSGRFFKLLSFLMILATFAVSFWAYPLLPSRVPSHWNAAGEINGYSSSFSGAFLLPIITLIVWLLFLVIPKIDPRKENFKLMGRVFWLFAFFVVLFLCVLHLGILLTALGVMQTNLVPFLSLAGIGILFIVIGLNMAKIKHNYFFGIRTPWTLASEEVWNKTHRTLGPWWVICGVIFLFLVFLPSAIMFIVLLVLTILLALGSVVWSYVLYRRLNRQ